MSPKRNTKFFDTWSVIHLVSSFGLTLITGPLIALVIVVAWEPLEVLVLSPLLAKRNIVFGNESLRNVMSDIIFDLIGVGLAVLATSLVG